MQTIFCTMATTENSPLYLLRNDRDPERIQQRDLTFEIEIKDLEGLHGLAYDKHGKRWQRVLEIQPEKRSFWNLIVPKSIREKYACVKTIWKESGTYELSEFKALIGKSLESERRSTLGSNRLQNNPQSGR